MREIKFRGKRIDNGEWVIDYQQHGDMQYKYIVSDVELIDAISLMAIKLKEEGVI